MQVETSCRCAPRGDGEVLSMTAGELILENRGMSMQIGTKSRCKLLILIDVQRC